jgi:hypothetical protein
MSPLFHDPFSGPEQSQREGYDVAQICLNGHCITRFSTDFPEHSEDFCSKCGQRTIKTCEKCKTPIRGGLRDVLSLADYVVPAFCHKCGAPYPWTETRLNVAVEMAKELDGLSEEEKTLLASTLDDLVREGPKTSLAATRFKRVIAKAGSTAAESFRKILVDIASETAKKMLWPDAK